MERRTILKAGLAGAVGTIAAPAVARAQETFEWRMTTTWPPALPFYQSGPGSAEYCAKKLEELSDGRMKVQVFAAGELIPAFGGFDAVSAGTVQMNHGCSYYWAGRHFAAQYFTTVPFGMNFQGINAWFYHGDGLKLWNELYSGFNLVAMPVGNSGVQMTGWFRKQIDSIQDLNGLKMRVPGLAGKVYDAVGVSVELLPGGEIFPALERGVIDAAEWVGPYQDRRLGLHNAAKYYYTTGWHEPSTTSELMINKQAWESLPKDLQAIVQTVARDTNLTGHLWCEAHNSEALTDLVANEGVTAQPLPDDVVKQLHKVTQEVLSAEKEKDPFTKKVHESFMKFKKQHNDWAATSEFEFQKIIQA